MYRKDAVERYKLFLNEIIELANAGQLKSLSDVRNKYGVAGGLAQFVKVKNIVTNTGNNPKNPQYEAIRKTPFSTIETQMFIAEFNRWKRNGTVPEPTVDVKFPKRKTPKKGSCLADCTTRELIAELKRRGYSGTLTIQKEITI